MSMNVQCTPVHCTAHPETLQIGMQIWLYEYFVKEQECFF